MCLRYSGNWRIYSLDFESRSRRENIRIYGVPEKADKESATIRSFVENLLLKVLDLNKDVPDLHIERAHRLTGPQPPDDAPPRSIIVTILSSKTKEKLIRKAWQRKRFTWQE